MPDATSPRCSHCNLYCDHPDWLAKCDRRGESITRLKQAPLMETLESDIERFAQRLRECQLPLITGYLGNVGVSQVMLRTAFQFRGIIGQWPFETDSELNTAEISARTISAAQTHGLMTTTFGEMRGSADGILIIGDDRLFERFPNLSGWLQLRKLSDRISQRNICLAGHFSDRMLSNIRRSLDDERVNVFTVQSDIHSLPASLASFQHASKAQLGVSPEITDCQRILQSNYLTALWVPELFSSTTYDLWLGRMTNWMIERSAQFRTNGIAMDSQDPAFQSVATWQFGSSGCLRFTNESAGDISGELSINQIVTSGNCDLIIWVDTGLEPRNLPRSVAEQVEFVVSSSPPANLPKQARWIGVQRQGVDCPMTGFRADKTIAGRIYDPIDGLPASGISIGDLGERMLRGVSGRRDTLGAQR